MIEYTQFCLHRPEQGEYGDCWKTCIACILHCDPYEIPHYYKEFWGQAEVISDLVHAATNRWLSATTELQYVETPIECTREQLGTYLKHYYKDMYVIIGCNSRNGGHSVVMRNDDYMWDPSIDKSGCVGPMDDGYWWIGVLISNRHQTKLLK